MTTEASRGQDILSKFGQLPKSAFSQQIDRAYRLLHDRQWYSQEEIRDYQLNLAKKITSHASKNVPIYRDLYGEEVEFTSWEDFQSLPTLSRAKYSSTEEDRKIAERIPPSSNKIGSSPTSGTTGAMVWIAHTPLANAWRFACILREFEWLGVDPPGDCAICRQPINHKSPDWSDEIGAEVKPCWVHTALQELLPLGRGYKFDIGLPIRKIADSILELQPAFLHGTPSFFLSIAEFLEGFRPKAILTISEQLFPDAKRKLESAYDAPVFDTYAAVEVNRVAASCPDADGYHVHDENVIFEVLDESDNPLSAGETGRVVITSLHNFATPIIRYELGDLAELGKPCTCCRGLTKVDTFHGRQVSRMMLGNGKYRVATSLILMLRDLPDVIQIQIVQSALDRFTVAYVANRNLAVEEEQRVRVVFEQLAERKLNVDFDRVERIPPLPNGKTPPFIVDPALAG
jgi:phenylacetate-CoA ligase